MKTELRAILNSKAIFWSHENHENLSNELKKVFALTRG